MEERGGGDVMTSLTTSDAQIAPQPPPARRVAGGTRPSASLRLLRDVPASPRRRASRLASSRPQRGPLWISSQPLRPTLNHLYVPLRQLLHELLRRDAALPRQLP